MFVYFNWRRTETNLFQDPRPGLNWSSAARPGNQPSHVAHSEGAIRKSSLYSPCPEHSTSIGHRASWIGITQTQPTFQLCPDIAKHTRKEFTFLRFRYGVVRAHLQCIPRLQDVMFQIFRCSLMGTLMTMAILIVMI